jgi:sterol 24-C-methyltransferase
MGNSATNTLEREDHSRDAAFNKALHGSSAVARGGVAAMLKKGGAAEKAAVDEYFKHWKNKSAKEETKETREVTLIGDQVAFC